MYKFYLFLLLNLLSSFGYSKVFINEILASNSNGLLDPDDHQTTDWIELKNSHSQPVDLSGYSIKYDSETIFEWSFPAGLTIQPHSYLILFANKKDFHKKAVHTNFTLSKGGGSIRLYDGQGQKIDELIYGNQYTDASYGRANTNKNQTVFFEEPTPGKDNSAFSADKLQVLPAISFSKNEGIYQNSFQLELSTRHKGVKIFYTLDGVRPDRNAILYDSPIRISKNTVVRARAFKADFLPSPVTTKSYLIDTKHALPIISITVAPDFLWDDSIGIYTRGTNGITGKCSDSPSNFNLPWERAANIEMFEQNGTLAFNHQMGIQIFGNCSRIWPSKSFALFARGKYGADKINYTLFNDKSIRTFDSFILRNGGSAFLKSFLSDIINQELVKGAMDIDYQSYRPSVVYINGKYRGILNIREKINGEYFKNNYGYSKDEIDLLEGEGSASRGSSHDYRELLKFVGSHDMSLKTNFDYAASRIDIIQFMNYQLTESYLGNDDWINRNIKFWRKNTGTGKYRWILYDTDLGLAKRNLNKNVLEMASTITKNFRPDATLLFRALLENRSFRSEFIQRFASHINSTFSEARVSTIIDYTRNLVASEMPDHRKRWGQSMHAWKSSLNEKKDFGKKRPAIVRKQIIDRFNLDGVFNLTHNVFPKKAGKIFAHGVEVPKPEFSGKYFMNIPIKLSAKPNLGYRFAGWRGASNSFSKDIELILDTDTEITAQFEVLDTIPPFISEINFHSPKNSNLTDWIELYNPNPFSYNVSGFRIIDVKANEHYTIPSGNQIKKNGFLIICKNKKKFRKAHPGIPNAIGDFKFGINSTAEKILILGKRGERIDTAEYGQFETLHIKSQNNLYSLELCNKKPLLNTERAWVPSTTYSCDISNFRLYSSPSAMNCKESELSHLTNAPIKIATIPTGNKLVIGNIDSESNVEVLVYNALGKTHLHLSGKGLREVFTDGFSPGLYFIKVMADDDTAVKKLLIRP